MQSDPDEHLYWGYLNLVLESVGAGTSRHIPLVALNNARIVSQLTPCKSKIFELVFGRKPGALGTYCCAQYLVSRRRLQLPKRETYKKILDMLDDREAPKPECGDIKGHSTH